jgi:hypothetical protein
MSMTSAPSGKLRRSNGTWNPRHGTWWFAASVPGDGGKRKQIKNAAALRSLRVGGKYREHRRRRHAD